MLSLQTVVPDTLELLRKIMGEPLFSDMRLVGGTALALQYGHRSSVDLDMFGTLNADNEDVEEVIGALFHRCRGAKHAHDVFTIQMGRSKDVD